MSVLRLLVADDHEIVRRGLCALLKSHAEWEVCAEAADGWEAVDKAQQLKPDIVILDIGMPNLNGLTATREILQAQPKQKILILTITDEEQVIREILEAGARGFVLKSDAARDLVAAIEALQAGTTFFSSRVGEMVLRAYLNQKQGHAEDEPNPFSLSSRERQIVQLLAEGKRTKEIASILDLSVKTTERYRANIMRKLGLHSRGELVLYAVRNHIIQVAPQ
ncbi:MAG TPA: response regulator transcription factor [Terriglobales bacterium]|nr:response regulator transcription factor [Terriglobales bacterium]